jgi:hypothetical protein
MAIGFYKVNSLPAQLAADSLYFVAREDGFDLYVTTSGGTPQAVSENALLELANKVDAEAGKGLSANDFTNALLSKLNGIAANATANQADAYLLDRANHTGTQAISTITGLAARLDNIEQGMLDWDAADW